MKLSRRLSVVASLIPKGKTVYDIGCDHAQLDIFLTLYNENICYACDKRASALTFATHNIQEAGLTEKIQTICSDGFGNVPVDKGSIAVICGMGTNTILEILEDKKIEDLEFLVMIPNNDYALFRKKLSEKNLCLTEEMILFEKGIFYYIVKAEKGVSHLNALDIQYGPILRHKKEIEVLLYYEHLLREKLEIYKKVPSKYLGKKVALLREIVWLKKHTKPLQKESRTA